MTHERKRWIRLCVLVVVQLISVQRSAWAEGVFAGSDDSGFSGNNTRYLGHGRHSFASSIWQSSAWWSTSTGYTDCTGTLVTTVAPGVGKSWSISMNYNESGTAGGQTCGSDLTPYVNSGSLCTISGTDRNCSFNVDLTTLNTGGGIAANSCFQLQVDGSGSPAGTGVITWDVSCAGASSSISSRGDSNTNQPFYCGSGLDNPDNCETTPNAATHFVNWSSSAINACEGWFALLPSPVPTPNFSSFWNVDIEVSTSAVNAGQNCNDLTYTQLTGCSIISTHRSCSTGSVGSCSVPGSGGCYRYLVYRGGGGGLRATSDQKFNLDVSDGQGSAWTLSRTATWGGGAATVRYLANDTGTSSTSQDGYAVVPVNLTGCDGGFMQTTVMAGGDQADLEIEYSTTALAAGNKCSSLTYTSTGTLCSVTSGNKSCTFSGASVPAVAGGCMRLKYTPTGTGGAAETVWGWHCQ